MSFFRKLFGREQGERSSVSPRSLLSIGVSAYPPGTRIGQYEIAGRPMVGGMGIVYVCNDLEQDRPVALKTFRPEYLPDRAARDRFLREGTVWVELGAHPHVVRCYEVLRIDLAVFLVLELVAKERGRGDASLRSWLAPGEPLSIEQALLFALQIARGMAHAAAVIPGFVHRDLKPENVLVGADKLPGASPSQVGVNRLRVTDFGLVSVLQETGVQTSEVSESSEVSGSAGRTRLTHGIAGTPLYMAPEQWRGEEITVATDVYALGCMLYEMLSGRRAVEGRSLGALEQAHCARKRPALGEEMPEVVRGAVERCLAVMSSERYGDWGSVEADLVAAYRQVSGREAPVVGVAAAHGREERVAAGWSYNAMGVSYLDLGKVEVAARYLERAAGVGDGEEERQLEEAALNNLGNAYVNLGDARRAIGCLEQALSISHEIGDRQGEGATLGNLGTVYRNSGDTRRAIGYYEQQLVITREIEDRRGEGNALMGLGNARAQLRDTRRAIGYYGQCLAIYREIRDRRGEGLALGNLGIMYANLGRLRRALGYLEQQMVITREIGDMRGMATVSFNIASLLAQQGRLAEALPYAEQAAQLVEQTGHTERAREAHQFVAQIRAALR